MAIQPVKYKNDSSTAGFAEAGDTIAITSNNANTIKKDVDQGNTESLNNAQQKWLDKWVDEDTLDYSDEEMQKVGENQIDTKGEDGEDLSEKDQKGGAAAAVGGAVAGAAGAAAVAITITATAKTSENAAKVSSSFPGGMIVAGGIAIAGGAVALACSFEGTFDSNLGDRKNQTNAAGETNTTIQSYIDKMNSDMDSMNEESGTYAELSDMTTQMTMDSITNVGALQAEMQVYQAQGNTEKVAELKGQIEKLQGESEKELEEPQKEMETIKGNLEQYTGNNAEAAGVKSSGDTVAGFLKDGSQMKNFAKAAQIASYVGVAAMAVGVVRAAMRIGKDLAGIFTAPFASVDNGGLLMFVAAGVMMGVAANNFGKIADSEGAAGSAGNEMAGYLASLGENVEAQAGFTEQATAGYLETDEASAETTDKTQQETDKANQKQGEALAGQQKPEEDKPEPEEENPVVAAGGGDGGAGAAGGAAA